MAIQNDPGIVRRFFDEVCNGRKLDVADELFSPDHVCHDPASPWVGPGPEGQKQLVATYQRWDTLVMLQQLGVVPQIATAKT